MPYWLMPTIRQGTNNFFTVILAVFDKKLKKKFPKTSGSDYQLNTPLMYTLLTWLPTTMHKIQCPLEIAVVYMYVFFELAQLLNQM